MKRRIKLTRHQSVKKFKRTVNRTHKINTKRATRGGFMM